ncbi:cation diffusion facilitator family transporter [Blattabacterium cuenoti]|uniref:cation diffusion facilitator family transporter n=1 Tax=Blattabacterium cuenoti TaxID=1653831 RepID=UPI00163C47A6|nr:cation diffusion facilitator family transporter [Blattabacterium cuenoti]
MNHSKKIQSNFFLQKVILFVSIFFFFVKWIAWKLTYSLSIFSDAMESLINVISGSIGLFCLYISSLPKDQNHPYGHGKIEFISTAIEGVMIFIAGIIIFSNTFTKWKGSMNYRVFYSKLDHGVVLMLITAIINYSLGYWACKLGKKNNNIILVASGKHLQIDTYSTIIIIIGLIILNKTKHVWIDPLLSLIFSSIILYTGFKLIRNATAGIMDESDKELLNKLSLYLNQKRNVYWIDLHHLKMIKYGSALHIDCHLTVPWYFNIKEANREVENLIQLTKNKFGSKVEFSVHVDACKNHHCTFCFHDSCKMRKNFFHKKILWTLNVVSYKNNETKKLSHIKNTE